MRKLIGIIASAALVLCLSGCVSEAGKIDERIANIGEVTVDSMEMLESIEADYQALSDEDKAKVESYDVLVAAIDECNRLNTDAEFFAALESSILSRMENSDSTDVSTLIETELVYLDAYRDAEFSSGRIEELANLYISGVDKQKEALGHKDLMYEYQLLWYGGLVDRKAALKAFNEEYGFLADNAEFIGAYVNGYEKDKFTLDAIEAVEADIGAQNDADEAGFEWSELYNVYVTYKNNTDYSFTTIFEFYFYTDDTMSTLLETTQAVAEVKPNSTYVVHGYHTSENARYCTWMNYYDMDSFV